MDWNRAVEINRDALLRIIAGLLSLANLLTDQTANKMARKSHRRILLVLQSAESAVRRLIVVAARWKAGPAVWRPIKDKDTDKKTRVGNKSTASKQKTERRSRFPLHDPPRRQADDEDDPGFMDLSSLRLIPQSSGMLPAKHLLKRLAVVKQALDDIPGEVERYLRWLAKPTETRRPKFTPAIRPGRPPGLPKKLTHDVHRVLLELHLLVINPPPAKAIADTS